jgi:hypothetical protein
MEPDRDPQYLFGEKDRLQRNQLLASMEEESYSRDGHKAAVYGDYGRGKTHQCFNLQYEIKRQGLPLAAMYIKCAAYGTKEPFQTFFRELVLSHSTSDLHRIAKKYYERPNAAKKIAEITQSEDIASVIGDGLTSTNQDVVRNSMRWLGGEAKVQMGLVSASLKPRLTESREFGAVARALGHIYAEVEGKIPLYLVDEAERFQNVTQPDAFYVWAASIRELTEVMGIGLMFFIGAKTRNELPTLFVLDEVIRRIGVTNYIEFTNPGRSDIEGFLTELLETTIRKGEVPVPHRDIVPKEALDTTIAPELLAITKNDPERLRAYPFEPDAFNAFVEQVTAGDLSSKPSEALIRLQKAAQRAMRLGNQTITASVVEQINSEGL